MIAMRGGCRRRQLCFTSRCSSFFLIPWDQPVYILMHILWGSFINWTEDLTASEWSTEECLESEKGSWAKGGLWMAGMWHIYMEEADDRDTRANPLSSDPGSLWHSDLDSLQVLVGCFENVLSDLSIVNGSPMMLRAASPLVVSLAGGGGGSCTWAISVPPSQVGSVWAVTVLTPCCICLFIKIRESLNVYTE